MSLIAQRFVQVVVCVVSPPEGVSLAVQRGKNQLLAPLRALPTEAWFRFEMRLGPDLADGSHNFCGEFAQGPATDRFVYINWGKRAGQQVSCWDRRAKLKLASAPRSLVESVVNQPGLALQAKVIGTGPDGGPACATVRPESVTWTVARTAFAQAERHPANGPAVSSAPANPDTAKYNAALDPTDKDICDLLAREIDKYLPEAENRIWHAHPVWFLDGNPVVGYNKLKNCVRLLFWSGQSFEEDALKKEGKFQAAEARYTETNQVDSKALKRWLSKARDIQWDYKNIVRRKGRLERLK